MSRIAYVNGAYVPHAQAGVHIEDRGYQFADGVYEVWAVRGGKLLDNAGHFARLTRSLEALRITPPMNARALEVVLAEVVRRNLVRNGLVYLQITRGVAPRDHAFPKGIAASIVVTARSLNPAVGDKTAAHGVAVITTQDERWQRCDIKSVSLLPNILAKQKAHEQGAYEAWLVDADGMVTEGSSSNAWIVSESGALVTRSLSPAILGGITRARVLDLAAQRQLRVEERAFSVAEAKAAQEAFITSSINLVMPVTRLDGSTIGDGRPGPVATALRKDYLQNPVT